MRYVQPHTVVMTACSVLLITLLSYVLDATDNFRVVSTNSLGEVAMSSPAIARGSLFIRTRSHLWRLTEGSR